MIRHEPVHVGSEHLTLGVGILTRDSAILVPGRNSDPSGEVSLSYMDTHDGLLYSIAFVFFQTWTLYRHLPVFREFLMGETTLHRLKLQK